jgi:hypothetical protein
LSINWIILKNNKNNKNIVDMYDKYFYYKNINVDKINNVYCYLNKEIPEEFVSWVLFNRE